MKEQKLQQIVEQEQESLLYSLLIEDDAPEAVKQDLKNKGRDPRVQEAIIRLWNIAPMFAAFLSNVIIKEATDEDGIHTLAAGYDENGRIPVVYYNPKFLDHFSPDEIIQLLCHECLHIWRRHFIRVQSRDHQLWNIATDKIINYILFVDKTSPLNRGGLALEPPKYDSGIIAGREFGPKEKPIKPFKGEEGMTSEEIYELLEKELKDNIEDQVMDALGGKGGGGNKKGKGGKGQPGKGDPQEGGGEGEGEYDPMTKVGDHIYIDNPNVAEEAERVIQDMIDTAIQRTRQRGLLSASDEEWVNKFFPYKPSNNWISQLRYFLSKEIDTIKKKYSYDAAPQELTRIKNIVSARAGRDVAMEEPETFRQFKYKVNVVIDTSGSMGSDDLAKGLGFLITIGDKYDVTLYDVSAHVANKTRITRNVINDIKAKGIKFKGRGGTDFQPYFDLMLKEKQTEKCVTVLFTDGYYGNFDDHGNKNFIVTVTGQTDSKGKNTVKVIDASKGGFKATAKNLKKEEFSVERIMPIINEKLG